MRCAQSVAEQSEQEYEWIIVDDGSVDGSNELLDQLMAADPRVRVLHIPNEGVSGARNRGLQLATAPWLMFLDIDDTLPQDALTKLLGAARDDEELSFVMAGYTKIINGRRSDLPAYRRCLLPAKEIAKELFEPSDYPYQGYICSKLYRRDIIQAYELSFNPKIKYNEDRLFTFTYLSHASLCAYFTDSVYEYYINGTGAMESINGPGFWKFETDLDAFLKMAGISSSYNSRSLSNLVLRGVYRSYNWNRRLNRTYGGNSKETNKRLKEKLYSVVSKRKYLGYRMDEMWTKYKGYLAGIARRLRIKY